MVHVSSGRKAARSKGLQRIAIAAALLGLACTACNKPHAASDKQPPASAEAPASAASNGGLAHTKPAPPDVAAPPADAQKSASGLAWKVLAPGTGSERPGLWDRVTFDYTGWTADGKMIDSTEVEGNPGQAKAPITIKVASGLRGWVEGLQTMVVGERRRFWLPEALAFQGQPNRPAGPMVYELALRKIERMESPPVTPPDVAGPPADAEKTESGLRFKVLTPGKGDRRPSPTESVRVHFNGWLTDGTPVGTSNDYKDGYMLNLSGTIKGLSEGISLMVAGEKRRFWIPQELAFAGQRGAPPGMLVYEVELLDVPAPPSAPPVEQKAAEQKKAAKKAK
jgi:peptidylprolyl isomerase